VKELPGTNGRGLSGQQRLNEDNQTENRETSPHAQKQVVAAAHGPLHQPVVYGRAHLGTAAVEPVTLGPGGIGAASPGVTGDFA